MTSTALRSSVVTRATPASSDNPAADSNETRKSAVFEYACLFTHDIRRKNTKRWQDGYLRFHQFNSRIMVYDQSRNYIGDTHYHSVSSTGLEDGDELQLERGGVLVQVAEKLSVQETDLTDLLSKRTPKAPAAAISRPTPSNNRVERPLPLNNVAARAQNPNRSPFEMRQSANAKLSHNLPAEQPRATKRLRIDDEHVPLRQLLQSSATSKRPVSAANNVNPATPSRTRTLFDKTKPPTVVREDITQGQSASQEDDGEQTGLARGTKTSISRRGGVFNSSSPPKVPSPAGPPTTRQSRGLSGRIDNRKAQEQIQTVSRRVSPPVSTTSHMQVELAPEDLTGSSNKETNPTPSDSNEQKKQKKPLRLATSAPRRKLLCHTLGTAIAKAKQKENISPKPIEPPNVAGLLPSAGVESPEKPTPNPDLDFNISSILDEDLSFLSPSANKAAQEPNIPPADPETNPLRARPDPPQPQPRAQRPFRRHASDTSPTKHKEPPTLQRAETICVPHEKQKQNLPTSARDAAEREPEDSGPWSREAWDLLGWCPSGRGETLGWRYFDP